MRYNSEMYKSSGSNVLSKIMKKYQGEYVLVKANKNTWKTENWIEGKILGHSKNDTELEELAKKKKYPKDKVYITYIPRKGEQLV